MHVPLEWTLIHKIGLLTEHHQIREYFGRKFSQNPSQNRACIFQVINKYRSAKETLFGKICGTTLSKQGMSNPFPEG